jgi:hypothetical protein
LAARRAKTRTCVSWAGEAAATLGSHAASRPPCAHAWRRDSECTVPRVPAKFRRARAALHEPEPARRRDGEREHAHEPRVRRRRATCEPRERGATSSTITACPISTPRVESRERPAERFAREPELGEHAREAETVHEAETRTRSGARRHAPEAQPHDARAATSPAATNTIESAMSGSTSAARQAHEAERGERERACCGRP